MTDPHDVRRLEGALGHHFADPDLLTEALTHRSAARPPSCSYERLEFLGDRVLGLVVAEMLFARFAEADEGELSRRHTALVRRDALADVAEDLDFGPFIVFASSDAETGRTNRGILADVCEALIGAVFLDGGIDPAQRFIERAWKPMVDRDEGAQRDAKTRLQEWAQARGRGLPQYEVASREGPDHAPRFFVTVRLNGEEDASGEGTSKRGAEQEAAAALLQRLGANGEAS
ncbi:MAG TPA: ribonuclease III [Caldimonas sp.]|nr:ribonuclease III [Caldimonas sp.]